MSSRSTAHLVNDRSNMFTRGVSNMKNLNVRSIDVAESFITDENVIIAAKSGVTKNIKDNSVVAY